MTTTGGLSDGVTLNFNSHNTTNVVNVHEDTDLALAIQEATRGFNPTEIQRLKALAESTIAIR
jgi:hypothetical protein